MKIHLIHGFNVSDGGVDTVGNFVETYKAMGHECEVHDLGMIGLLSLRCKNAAAVRRLCRVIEPGDVILGHSNGALICWQLLQAGCNVEAVITINASMRRDTKWPRNVPVLCLHNKHDWVVQLGRAWGRLVSLGGMTPHGWGAAGRYGFTRVNECVTNWDTSGPWWDYPARGHSSVLKLPAAAYWAKLSAEWLERRGAGRAINL